RSQAVGELGNNVRCRRCDEKQGRAVSEFDVAGPPIFLLIEEARRHWIFLKRLESKRRNKFSRMLGHDDKHFMSLFDEQTGELGGFISGDRSGDSEHY